MREPRHRAGSAILVLLVCVLPTPMLPAQEGLERALLAEGPAALAQAARRTGDPRRGAILFHRASLG